MKLKVVGFDPSLSNTGIASGLYDLDTGKLDITRLVLIETEKESGKKVRVNSDDLRRGSMMSSGVHEALEGAAVAFAEIPSGAQSARAAFTLGVALGVMSTVGCVGPFKGRLIQVMPSEVKKLATGSKVASKEEMIEWAHELWPDADGWITRKLKGEIVLQNKNEHLADACAAIHAGIHTDEFKSLVQVLRSMGQAA